MAISLSVNMVRIKALNGPRNEFQLLDSFSDEEADLYDFVLSTLNTLKAKEYDDEDTKRSLQILRIEKKKRRIEAETRGSSSFRTEVSSVRCAAGSCRGDAG